MKLKSQKGTSTVEFALIAPLLFLLLFGIVEFSLILYDKAMITNASREGARLGVVYRLSGPGTYSPPTATEILNRVDQYLKNPGLISFSSAGYSAKVLPSDGCQSIGSGNPLLVTVTYDYQFLILNFLTTLINPIRLQADATMNCE